MFFTIKKNGLMRCNMNKISIIIPVYNDQYNIANCLDSIFEHQSLKSIEVICINDGSTDGTTGILRRYASKYSNMVLIEQKNKGLSAARNVGIKIATGKYVYFVDSDDILENDMLSFVWERCEHDKLDVLFFSFRSFGDNEKMNTIYSRHINDVKRTHEYTSQVVTGLKLMQIFCEYNEYYPMVWIQVVNREFLLNNAIVFDENIIYEDNLYTFQILNKATRTYCINKELYLKRIRENSITTTRETVISVYSFFHTFLRMIQFLGFTPTESNILKLTQEIGNIHSCYAYILNTIHLQFLKRYFRLDNNEKECLYDNCSVSEKKILDILGIKVSVIIPMYNMQRYIADCIRSVQNQTQKNLEIIIIDDGSTDSCAEIVKSLMKADYRIQYYYQDNSGSGVARNLGLKKAQGKYIAFLDSDDFYYDNDALERMVAACQHFQVPICGSYRVEMKNGMILKTDFLKLCDNLPFQGTIFNFMDYQNDFFYQSYIYKNEFICDNNIMFPPYRRYQDPPFLLKALDLSKVFAIVPTTLHCYRKGHQDHSNNGKYIAHTLKGIRDNMLLCENKYNLLFDLCVTRLETMFVSDITEHMNDEVRSLINEINTIYKRKYPYKGDMALLKTIYG